MYRHLRSDNSDAAGQPRQVTRRLSGKSDNDAGHQRDNRADTRGAERPRLIDARHSEAPALSCDDERSREDCTQEA